MKYYIIILLSVLGCYTGNAQGKALDFNAVMTYMPMSKKITVIDFICNGGEVTRENRILTKIKKSDELIRQRNNQISMSIDGMQLIDYKSDTIYIISTIHLPTFSVSSEIIKTRQGEFAIMNDYSIKLLADSYTNVPKEYLEETRQSDFLLYETIFSWDMNRLEELIRNSAQVSGSEYLVSAMKVIINNNQIVKKELANFEPAIRWRL